MASTIRLLSVYFLQTVIVSLTVIRFCYTASSNTDALIKSSKTRNLDTECPQDKQWPIAAIKLQFQGEWHVLTMDPEWGLVAVQRMMIILEYSHSANVKIKHKLMGRKHLWITYNFPQILLSSMTTCVVHWCRIEKILYAVSVPMALVPQWPHLGTSVSSAPMLVMGYCCSCLSSSFQLQFFIS